ncbi:DNA-3-methyladenine glycosylase 2 family protein [Nesterenkonia halotolerans]|uniref:DNA-3-methyladenine glycosylase II n=1 Tax=Nesterenkonia halotolerans TaxID=225325 RepID=A0ABR9J3Y3_9MICC|nr:Ada metal-binding domain-containing protein [Nesterenkonia halotolerans]MBE1513696.1 AraC family transcriptional regulator of adaptative response / DNA-3-methyladenine glycosylase II [Nesterenkonia halotolerans]
MEQSEDFDRRYRAVQSRDRRFDGQFYTAVSSTKIYCRPSCPAQTPKPENVTFFSTSAAAHEHGYRACKRCLPDATPGTPEWNIRQDLAGRAMRLIREGAMNDGGVGTLSDRLGYSSRHLHRTLTAELGAGPLALARAHRMHLARSLLVSTQMSITDIAFASGFSSVRQFNETASTLFGAAPREIRQRAHRSSKVAQRPPVGHKVADAGPRLSLRLALPVREPFDAVEVFRFLDERAIPGVEATQLDGEALVYARTLRLTHGPAAIEVPDTEVSSTLDGGDSSTKARRWQLQLDCELSSFADIPAAVAVARRIFDLDADPQAVVAALSADPALAPWVRESPGLRMPGTADGPEYLIRAIVGQQISVVAARTQLTRLVDVLGTPLVSSFTGLSRLFPTPEEILAGVPEPPSRKGPGPHAALDPERPLRLPARSISTVRVAAQALASGELQLHQGADTRALHDQLTAMPGIGQWTASYLMLRVLGDPDVWMTGDVVLLTGAKKLGLLDPELNKAAAHRALQTHAQRWSPWRSYAAMYLWKAAAQHAADQPRKDPSS